MPRNLLVVAPHISPTRGFGGPSVSIRTFVDHLQSIPVNHIVISSAPYKFCFKRTKSSLEFYFPSLLGHRYGLSLTGLISILFASFTSDLFIINGLSCPFNLFATFLALLNSRRKAVVFTRGGLQTYRSSNFSRLNKCVYRVNLFILRRLSHQGRLVLVFQSLPEYQTSEHLHPAESHIIGNVTEAQYLASPSTPFSCRTIDFLYVGRYSHEKGIDRLLSAIDILNSLKPNLSITLVFDKITSQQKQTLLQYSNSLQIQILVGLDSIELSRIYASSKFLYFPSYSENYANVIVEAVSHRVLPIVYSDTHWSALLDFGAFTFDDFLDFQHTSASTNVDNKTESVYKYVFDNYIQGNSYHKLDFLATSGF